jgi:hypothetical protein
VLLVYFAVTSETMSEMARLKTGLGGVMSGCLAFYMFAEWRRLLTVGLVLHERGFVYSDKTMSTPMLWADVAHIEARYVPGLRKRGAADEGNLVAVVITSKRGVHVHLPRELAEFRDIVSRLKKHSDAPVENVVVANVMQR